MRKQSGFTLIELTIVIIIISVLVGISSMAYSSVQVKARDSIRASKAKIIADAIQKKSATAGMTNGVSVYCSNLTGDAATVADYLDIGVDNLRAPQATVDNSISCPSHLNTTDSDIFTVSGLGCKIGHVTYYDEFDNTTKQIQFAGLDPYVTSSACLYNGDNL